MLDIQFIRENKDFVKRSTAAKQIDPEVVDRVLDLDEKRRKLIPQIESLRKKRNTIASKGKASEEGKKIKEELKNLEPEFKTIEEKYKKALYEIPNPPAKDVKEGRNDSENEVVRKEGKITKFDFSPKPHFQLGDNLDLIDVTRAAKVSGSRFGYLRGDGALLEFALINFAFEILVKEGFIPVVPPVLISQEMMKKMGYMEHGGAEQMYLLDKDGLVLVGTSEQSVGPMHANETLDAKDLPLRYVSFSSCFRREAGTYGKDTKGILRVHQFDKVEMFSFTKPQDSDKEHDFLLRIEENLLQKLGLPYQVVKMCSGDLGDPAARKYDLEVWIPSEEKYRELTSTSTCTDYQSRALGIKYLDGGESKLVHTLNGTAFAIGRTIIAILENYQQKHGSVAIPKPLQKWMGKKEIKVGS